MKTTCLILGLGSLLVLGACKGSEAASTDDLSEVAPSVESASATSEVSPADAPASAGPVVNKALINLPDGEPIRSGEIAQPFPVAFQRWGEAVDALNADLVYWVRALDGHMKPLTWVKVSGQPLIKGYVCEMWACGMNEVVYLMRPDQSRIVGIAKLDEDKPQRTEYLIGNPTPEEARCLRFYLANEDDDSDC